MDENDLITIVVPNYNNEPYLEGCLDSILAQDHDQIEVIVIDDASSDNSAEIIRSYARSDQRIDPIFNEMNRGVAVNRNRGILRAKGKYLTTLDSDDVLLRPDKLRREYELMCTQRSAGVNDCIVFSGIVLLNADGGRIGVQNANILEGEILNQIVRRTCLIPRDFLFTREQYLAAGGFDTRIPIYEDWDLKIRLAKKNRFYYSGIDGIGYRRHGTGLSAVSPLSHAWWLSRIFLKNFSLLRSDRKETFVVFTRMILRMVRNHLKNSRKK